MSTGMGLLLLVNSRGCGITSKNGKGTSLSTTLWSVRNELMEEVESETQGLQTV